MHAVIVTVDIDPDHLEEAQKALHENVVPMVSKVPGLVAAYWLDPRPTGRGPLEGFSLLLAKSHEAAEGMATMARESPTPPGVRISGATVRDVVASC